MIEQLQFTSLIVGALSKDDKTFLNQQPSTIDKNVTLKGEAGGFPKGQSRLPAQWDSGWLPDGFFLESKSSRASPVNDYKTSVFTFSDGIARFSVFIEPDNAPLVAEASRKKWYSFGGGKVT